MKRVPLVTIVIPTYNYGKYICEAIDSVLTSSFPMEEVEIVVVDDGSTDDTAQVVKRYQNKVTYIFQENSGKAQATREAIENSCGRYILNLDADDLFLPNKIQEVVNIFESDPDIVHVGHPALFWNVDGDTRIVEKIPNKYLGKKTLGKSLISHFYRTNTQFGGGSTFAARREILEKFPIPREVDMYVDEYILLVALTQGYSFFLDQPMSIWRIHSRNFSQNQPKIQKLKAQRSLASAQAVFNELDSLGLEEEIQKLYQLKLLTFSMLVKEQIGEKSLSDILGLVSFFSQSIPCFGLNIWRVIQGYRLLNRALPIPIILFLKTIKEGYHASSEGV